MDKKDGGTIDLESLRGFTPGPWKDETGSFVRTIGGAAIASVYGGRADCMPDAIMRANARLIAAAPSMHAKLTARRARDAEVKALVAAAKTLLNPHTPVSVAAQWAHFETALLPFTGAKP